MPVSDLRLIEAICDNFPLESKPFAGISRKLGISKNYIVRKIEQFKKKGIIKRFKILFHKEVANQSISCLVAWNIPARLIEEVGRKMSEFNEVSWCRHNPKLPDFPYNLYTQIYGESREEIINIVRKISSQIAINHHKMLWTEKEYKDVLV